MNPAVRFALVFGAMGILAGCTAVANDLNKGFAWGTDQNRLTRKVDDRRKGRPSSGVNAYLWRASLDTLGYLPLEVADAKAGRIVTQWYASPGTVDERTRLTVEVLDPDLRRDTIRVAVARQTRQGGAWVALPAPALSAQDIEETILQKARELRGN
jgi:Domain of unknown function (DUF3576)